MKRIRVVLTVWSIRVLAWLMLRITASSARELKRQGTMNQVDSAARAATNYGPIQLLRVGDYATVRVEISGEWVEVIREPVENNFDHTVYPAGMVLRSGERQKCAQ